MDFNVRYRHPDWPGIAWNVYQYHTYRDEDYEWSGIETVDENYVDAHMVGDDRKFTFETEDMIPLSDDEYCPSCGQIGCGHDTL